MTRVRPLPVRSAAADTPPAPSDRRSFLLLLTASGGCAMSLIDTNVIALAVPAIASGLDAGAADAQWIISAFFLAFAAALLPAGAIADRNGRRRTFLAGLIGLALSALACGLAPGMAWMTLGRALQGLATAFVLAPALALIGHKFHAEAERTRAWAIWGGMMGLTMVLAPLAGGLVIQFLGWRAAFFLIVPLCVLLAVATIAYADESRDLSRDKPDPAGILLFAASMFGLVFGLISGQSLGWGSMRALGGLTTGVAALIGFILVERAQPHAMLDLRLFRDPRFVGAVWAMFIYAATAQVMASLLPIFLQTGGGLPPAIAGFAMMPFASAMLVFPYVGARLGRHLSTPSILGIGLATVAVGNVMVGLGTAWDAWPGLFAGMFVIGSGAGLLNGETQKAIMMTIPRERAGIASGISTTARFSGILLGFAVLTAVFATTVRMLIPASGGAAMADAVIAGDLASALAGAGGDTALQSLRQLYGTAYSAAFFAAAVVAAASAVLVWRLLRRPARRT